MTVKNKKIVAVTGVFVLLFLIGYWLFPKEQEQTQYIFDKSYNISLEDVKKARKSLPRNKTPDNSSTDAKPDETYDPQETAEQEPELDIRGIFGEGLINSYTTLKYFKHLEHLFRKSTTLGEHFDEVKKYLFAEFSEEEAQILFETYKNYLQCEMDLLEEFRNLTSARSTEEAIQTLKQIQDFRRDRLGVDLADKLFGSDVKAKEYAFRRADIVGDEALYGQAKEDLLKQLNEDMWGEDADAIEEHPNDYNRYKEKLLIYKKDIEQIESEEERQAKVKGYRTEFFTPEVVKRLDDVDMQIASEKQNEVNYREEEKKILENTGLTEETKNKKIEKLQSEMFGEEADAFRRRETMRLELEKMIQENKKP